RLHVDDNADGNSYDHADWAGARLLGAPATGQPPTAPVGLAATAASPTQVNLTWSDVTGESGYKIERSPDGVSGWAQIGTSLADQATYSDVTAQPKTQYFY